MSRRLPVRYTRARQAADNVAALIPCSSPTQDTNELIRAALQLAILKAYESGELAMLHPLLLEAADRKRRELAIKEETLALARRRLEVFEQSTRLRDKRVLRELDLLEGKHQTGQELTAEDLHRIRAIYGLETTLALNPGQEELPYEPLDSNSEAESDPA